MTKSNLTGMVLPKNALQVTDIKATTPFNQYLRDVAIQLGGSCEHSEFLMWKGGDSEALTGALAGSSAAAGYTIKNFEDLDAAVIKGTTGFQEFAMASSKNSYAAVWVTSSDDVMLGWCNVK
ncbi:hypothetical protein FNU79_16520 [Deinococcus detaillensis]|uniref:Uncharacterized protein n=1 Tax=Deinococcus detaillensis TaxID=2592048 RepID=A0A553UK09_9DEIO|nr:hypothetical protein [Deinococcus detaillensis]TSA80545.1 hypothetical protein FNU79_16520 [Deinococcus detaillensis]